MIHELKLSFLYVLGRLKHQLMELSNDQIICIQTTGIPLPQILSALHEIEYGY